MGYEVKEISREGGIDLANKGNRTYTRKFMVTSTEVDDDVNDIAAVAGLPANRSSYPTDSIAVLQQKRATQRANDPHIWDVECNYDSTPQEPGTGTSDGSDPTEDPGGQDAETQPDLRPPVITIDTIETKKIFVKDFAATPKKVTNSAGQPFDPPHEIPSYHPQITITLFKAIGSDSYANMTVYCNKVNQGVWRGFADQTVLCKKYKLTTSYEHGQWWWNKEVVLEVNPDEPWNPLYLLDCGTYEAVYPGGSSSGGALKYIPIKDAQGANVTSPVLLKNGRVLPPGEDAAFLPFTAYKKVSFASIL